MDSPKSKQSFGARVLRKFESRPNRPPTRLESYRTTLMNLDDYLPQPEEDRKIASKVQQLQSLIEAHAIYHYYHNRPVDLKPEDVQSLLQRRLFGRDDEDACRRLASNLLRPSHRATFIRIVVARALIAAIDLQGNPATSLLPQEIVLFMTAFKNTPRSRDNDQVDEVALCEWRRIASYLLSNAQSRTNQLQNTASRVNSMVDSLNEILCVFAEPDHIGEGSARRLGNLRSIVSVTTDIGVLLFGQPCGWELNWTVRPTNDTYEMPMNGAHRPQSRLSQQHIAASAESSTGDMQQEITKEPRKRKKRFQELVRSQSSKEKERERDKPRKDKDRPPLTASILRFAPPQQSTGENEAGLYRIRTGESESQHKGIQREHPQSRYQEYEDRRLAEQQGIRNLKERSRSEPYFTPIYQQESTQYRNTYENANPLKEIMMHETRDPLSFKTEVEDVVSLTARDGDVDDTLQSGQKRPPETPGAHSTHTRAQESFLDNLEQRGPIRESQVPNHSGRLPEQSRFVSEQQHHSSQPSRSLEHSRFHLEPQTPVRPNRPIIYFPALLKVGDEYGCRMTQPLLVLEPMVDRTFLTPWY